MTSNDPKKKKKSIESFLSLSLGHWVKSANETSRVAQYKNMYIEIDGTFLLVLSEKLYLNIFPLPYNGQVSKLT